MMMKEKVKEVHRSIEDGGGMYPRAPLTPTNRHETRNAV